MGHIAKALALGASTGEAWYPGSLVGPPPLVPIRSEPHTPVCPQS